MISVDNQQLLQKKFPAIYKGLMEWQQASQSRYDFQVKGSKKNDPTLAINRDGKEQFINSAYDPEKEAMRWAEQFEQLEEYDHVFFYGIGLGYHVKAFTDKFPQLSYSMYEPFPEVFELAAQHTSLSPLLRDRCKHLFVEFVENQQILEMLSVFSKGLRDKVLLIHLPSYERLFPEKVNVFLEQFQLAVRGYRSNLHTNLGFQKLWTLNSIQNFKHVLKTPNVLEDIDRQHFQNKPAVIVSAGPSLEDEIERLKQIKANKMAYIFSVGSANKVLIANGIYPDAVLTYDPQMINENVFKEIIEQKLDIPMIYGSSVGYTTVEKYPGRKLHMLTSQDSISANFLKKQDAKPIRIVLDAPSIAVLAIQLMSQLGCNPLILAGQNLSFRNNQFYAKGISYEGRSTELTEKDKRSILYVNDVNGNKVETTSSYISMKKQIEMYIQKFCQRTEVLNTTNGGAHIEGSTFVPLQQIMDERLKENAVDSSWINHTGNQYSIQFLAEKQEDLKREAAAFEEIFKKMTAILSQMEQLAKGTDEVAIKRSFQTLDKHFKKLQKNKFYSMILAPMNRVQFGLAMDKIKEVKFDQDVFNKAETISKEVGRFLWDCRTSHKQFMPFIQNLFATVEQHIHPPVEENEGAIAELTHENERGAL